MFAALLVSSLQRSIDACLKWRDAQPFFPKRLVRPTHEYRAALIMKTVGSFIAAFCCCIDVSSV